MAPDPDRRTQLLRGALDMCLLALLVERPTHAYELVVRLEQRGVEGVSYGTVYPLMRRLHRDGLVRQRGEPSPTGPPRKVFEVSPAGRRALTRWTDQWVETTAAITGLLASVGAIDNHEVRTDA